jgi:hypothetical protein
MSHFQAALKAVDEASTAQAAVEAVRGFLETLTAEELAELPWGLCADLVRSPSDVAMWSLHLPAKAGGVAAGAAYGLTSKLLRQATFRMAELKTA